MPRRRRSYVGSATLHSNPRQEIESDSWLGMTLRENRFHTSSLGMARTFFVRYGSLTLALFENEEVGIGCHASLSLIAMVPRIRNRAATVGCRTLWYLVFTFSWLRNVRRSDVVLCATSSPSSLRCTAELQKYKRLDSPGQKLILYRPPTFDFSKVQS